MSETQCPHAKFCSGCDLLSISYPDQLEIKKLQIQKQLNFPDLKVQSFQPHFLRSRLDFTIHQGHRGLYHKNSKEIVDLPTCLQVTPELQDFLTDFRKISFPISKGSFRLRISPEGKRGVWLDFSGLETRDLLQEGKTLSHLRDISDHVELGQRHKSLIRKKSSVWGLGEPEFFPWTQSFWNGKTLPLVSTVGAFTQPSHLSNDWIVKTLSSWFSDLKLQRVLEFGSGIGNLTFPALSYESTEITSLELNPLSLTALERNLKTHGVQDRVRILPGDGRTSKMTLPETDGVLVNPARNGVGTLFHQLFQRSRLPKSIVYMSCYPETMALDTQILHEKGYHLDQALLVDQFPQTHHSEVLARWSR